MRLTISLLPLHPPDAPVLDGSTAKGAQALVICGYCPDAERPGGAARREQRLYQISASNDSDEG